MAEKASAGAKTEEQMEEEKASTENGKETKDTETKSTNKSSAANVEKTGNSANAQEWKELMGKELILKVNKDKKGGKGPEFGDAVYIDYKARILGPDSIFAAEVGPTGEKIDEKTTSTTATLASYEESSSSTSSPVVEDSNVLITLGDADIIPAIELGVRYMTESGCSTGTIRCLSKYAYGPFGMKQKKKAKKSTTSDKEDEFHVQPSSAVEIDVTLGNVIRQDDFDVTNNIQRCKSKKTLGNDCFSRGSYDRAIQFYKKAADILSNAVPCPNVTELDDYGDPIPKDEQEVAEELAAAGLDDALMEEASQLIVDCYNNMTLCQIERKEYAKAKEACASCLKWDPTNCKGLCRSIRIALALGSYEDADKTLAKATKFHPEDADVRRMARLLKDEKRMYKKEQKELYEKMMKNPATKKEMKEQKEQYEKMMQGSVANKTATKTTKTEGGEKDKEEVDEEIDVSQDGFGGEWKKPDVPKLRESAPGEKKGGLPIDFVQYLPMLMTILIFILGKIYKEYNA